MDKKGIAIKAGDRVRAVYGRKTVTGRVIGLHDRGGTVTPVSCFVRWDHRDHGLDANLADLVKIDAEGSAKRRRA